jgi:hypothetical protein
MDKKIRPVLLAGLLVLVSLSCAGNRTRAGRPPCAGGV